MHNTSSSLEFYGFASQSFKAVTALYPEEMGISGRRCRQL
jgi:hypothetical protein